MSPSPLRLCRDLSTNSTTGTSSTTCSSPTSKSNQTPKKEIVFFRAIQDERTYEARGQYDSEHIFFDRYNTFEQIESYLFKIHEEKPELVKIREIGKTHENRTLWVVQVSLTILKLQKYN